MTDPIGHQKFLDECRFKRHGLYALPAKAN